MRRRLAWMGLCLWAGLLAWAMPSGAAGAAGAAGAPEGGPRAQLVVEITGLPTDQGLVRIALFDQAQGFPEEGSARRKAEVPVRDGRARWELDDLAPGEYALAFYQDLRGLRRLETNFLGIPQVPYGFSGQGSGLLGGAPDFGQARVLIKAGPNRLALQPR